MTVRVTIYADSLDDADRAMRAVLQDARTHPQGHGPRQRDGSLWSGMHGEDLTGWHALVWGGPDHWRADCRSQSDEDEQHTAEPHAR